MEVEKRSSKGGFLNLLDWGAKSRKKLFPDSSSSELPPVGLKKEKDNVEKLATPTLNLVEVNENASSSINKICDDNNCGSSITSDEGNGGRTPGVVARLMGLDSLPTSSVCEPFIESFPINDTRLVEINTNFWSEHCIVNYNIMQCKEDGFSRTIVSSKSQRWPIERFQSESLPRKSAKTIPVTHNKHLSPIKSLAYVPTRNKAYTMEVASRMIEPSHKSTRASSMSSSVPLRIRDLREKIEASQKASRGQRSKETDTDRPTRGQLHHKNNRSERAPLLKASLNKEKCSSDSLKNNGKSLSHAVLAKTNAQRKEVSVSEKRVTRKFMNQKEPNEIKSNQRLKSQSNIQITRQNKTSISGISSVLRQNSHKQNNMPPKEKITSKTSLSTQQSRKSLSTNKVVLNSECRPRKIGLVANVTEKVLSPSRTKTSLQNKLSDDEGIYFEKRVSDNNKNDMSHKDGKSVQRNTVVDGCIKWGPDKKKKGMDIISFTFSSPVKKSRSSGQNDPTDTNLTSQGINVMGADAVSILLQKKLRELTYKMESSQYNLAETETASALSFENSIQNVDILSVTSITTDIESETVFSRDKYDSLCESSNDDSVLKASPTLQDEASNHCNHSGAKEDLDCLYPIQLSSLDPFLWEGSYYSPNNNRCTNDNNLYFMDGSHKEINSFFEQEFYPTQDEVQLSNSASSRFTMNLGNNHAHPQTSIPDFIRFDNWALHYLRDILGNADFMLDDFVSSQVCQVITQNLFDQLETVGNWEEMNSADYSKLERKVLFDFVRETLDFKSGQLSVESFNVWKKCVYLFQKKGWLVDELHKDISGFRDMEDLMVDELVEKDMSTDIGKWLDFRNDEFEVCVEIEKGILNSLVGELVSDIYVKQFIFV